jgi:hypothetical protein
MTPNVQAASMRHRGLRRTRPEECCRTKAEANSPRVAATVRSEVKTQSRRVRILSAPRYRTLTGHPAPPACGLHAGSRPIQLNNSSPNGHHFSLSPELLALLNDTVPKLCKTKRDLLLFFQGAGLDRVLLAPYERLLRSDKDAFNKYNKVPPADDFIGTRGNESRNKPNRSCRPR